MATIPMDVLLTYLAAVIWMGILGRDIRRGHYTPTLIFGVVFAIFLNLRYLVDGAPDSIAFFVSLYDLFDNLGLGTGETAPALASCPDNQCSLWGARYTQHSSWGVAFHDRFLNGPALRSNLLYLHLAFNTIAFVLMHVQLAWPARAGDGGRHRVLGRVLFLAVTLGTICAVWLAAELGPVSEYGGAWSKYGFWFMSVCVYGCAVMGVLSIRKGHRALHRIWMIRFAGSMWGAFWLFRLMLIITGPLLRQWESLSLLLSIWLSAPLGIAIAEWMRRRLARRPGSRAGAEPVPHQDVPATALG